MRIQAFRGKQFYLSNYYEAPVTYKGLTYQNNEAAFQAQKCVEEKDRERFAAMSPSEAKRAGRKVALREDWEQVKVSVMAEIVMAKFKQNDELAKKLIGTGDAYLEEGNRWGDHFWGVSNGYGCNCLGLILMGVRDALQTENR